MMIVRTEKETLTFGILTLVVFSVMSALFAIDRNWERAIPLMILAISGIAFIIRAFQFTIFLRRKFILIYCLERKEHIFYNDIEDVYITTVIREKKKPKKWIILRHFEQSLHQINFKNLDTFIQEVFIISFPYSERREKLMDRHFPGKKKYAVLHDKTGVLEEVEPTEMPSAE